MDIIKGTKQLQIDDHIQDPAEQRKFGIFKNEHREEFMDAFNFFDKNQDGRICIDELGKVMQACGQNPTHEDVMEAMIKFDRNKDGKVEFDEFVLVMFKIYQNPVLMSNSLREAFKVFDKDSNGLIDASEFRNIVTNLGGDPLHEKEIAEMMAVADTNRDGKIDYNEFCGILEKQ
ncbi:neo-calmodulin-like [Mizuhopecten yessoensis]|uniref:neo-calmodulin-like n=1 Tax=Mizuhopecten yessoensis TaxID=6573 RepID=UPI000B45E4E8|nr:neo-calmodulin-like [Mizuhopecten yessoensis]